MIIHATQSISFANNSPPPQELLKMNKSNKNKRPRSVRQNVVKLRQRPEWSKARNAICIIWGLDLILVFCSCLETFFHPRDILSHLCLDIHQNHFGLNLPSYCCLGPLPKPKRPHFVWCVGCLRQRPRLLFPGWGFFILILALFCLLLGNTIWQTSVQLLFAQN